MSMRVPSVTSHAATVWAVMSMAIGMPVAAWASNRGPDPAELGGVLRCSGGSTMRPLVRAWARAFERLHPRVHIEVDPRVALAAGGFEQLLAGRTDLVDFVREPFPAEIAAFERKFGYPPRLVTVADGSFDTPHATDAIAVFVNAVNPLRRLSLAQLERQPSRHRQLHRAQCDAWRAVPRRPARGAGPAWSERPACHRARSRARS